MVVAAGLMEVTRTSTSSVFGLRDKKPRHFGGSLIGWRR
jgi:hypothetical protein